MPAAVEATAEMGTAPMTSAAMEAATSVRVCLGGGYGAESEHGDNSGR